MFLWKKQKIQDIGKDNFKEFFIQERSSVQKYNNSPQHTNQNNDSINKMQPQDQFNIEKQNFKKPNMTQVQQLDKFLQSKDCAQTAQIIPIQLIQQEKRKNSPDFSLSSKANSIILNNKQTNSQQQSMNSSKISQNNSSKLSFCFTTKGRYCPEFNANKIAMSDINPLVSDIMTVQQNAKQKIIDPIFQQNEKRFSPDKLEPQYLGLQSPSEKRAELIEVKKNKQEFQKWRKSHMDDNKKYKLMKSAYRSGVLQLDSPELNNSSLYKEESNYLQDKKQKEAYIKSIRLKNIEKYIQTNPNVNIDNVKYDERAISTHRFPEQTFILDSKWKMRKHQASMKDIRDMSPNTYERIFGNNINDQKSSIDSPRSKFLRQQDLYGKNYNLISNTSLAKI